MGYAPAGMRFNGISTRHMSDTFHVCYEVTSVNTAELRSAMRDGDRQNTGKSVDHGSVMEQSVAGDLNLVTPPFSGAYVSLDSSAVSFDSFRGAADPSV